MLCFVFKTKQQRFFQEIQLHLDSSHVSLFFYIISIVIEVFISTSKQAFESLNNEVCRHLELQNRIFYDTFSFKVYCIMFRIHGLNLKS